MGWRDRLRTALAAVPAQAEAAEYARANSANCSDRQGDPGQLAQSAQLAEGYFPQNAPAGAALTSMHAACDARAAALTSAFDAPDVAADRAAIAADVWPLGWPVPPTGGGT